MFLSFEVENFRSIKDPVEIKMTAVKYYKEQNEQVIKADLPGLKGIDYLRAAAIYGPNAAGKSSFWKALGRMQEMIIKSATIPPDVNLPYEPFALSEETQNAPTSFSVVFTMGEDNIRYKYSFSYNANEILKEKLSAYPKAFEQVWFMRTTENGETKVKGSAHLRIPAALKPLLNNNVLLLSLLSNYPKMKGLQAARNISNWFKNEVDLYTRAPEAAADLPYSGDIIKGVEGTDYQRKFIKMMMQKADVGIVDMEVEEEKMDIPQEVTEALNGFLKAMKIDAPPDDVVNVVVFDHKAHDASMRLPYASESDGTQQVFGMSGHISRALEQGSLLFVDELDASLHPLVVREIVQMFLHPETNPKNAQLIFTAHNPCLLESGLLRRDQIWFAEKNTHGETQIYPLSDFSPRKDEAIISGYLSGKYSAIPFIPAYFGVGELEGDIGGKEAGA